jgi:hypothetical protein
MMDVAHALLRAVSTLMSTRLVFAVEQRVDKACMIAFTTSERVQ